MPCTDLKVRKKWYGDNFAAAAMSRNSARHSRKASASQRSREPIGGGKVRRADAQIREAARHGRGRRQARRFHHWRAVQALKKLARTECTLKGFEVSPHAPSTTPSSTIVTAAVKLALQMTTSFLRLKFGFMPSTWESQCILFFSVGCPCLRKYQSVVAISYSFGS